MSDEEVEIVEESPEVEVEDTQVEEASEPQEVDIRALVEQAKNPPKEEPKEEVQEPQEEDKDFDPKKDRVEFDTPEQQAKFNDVYKQMKNSDARNKMLTDLLNKMSDRLDAIEGKSIEQETQETEALLYQKVLEANEEGDTEALTRAVDDLAKYRGEQAADRKYNELMKQVSTESERDAQAVLDFMNQTNDTGENLYPWMQEDHPQFEEFVKNAAAIGYQLNQQNPNDPNIVYKTIEQVNRTMMDWDAPKQQTVKAEAPPPKTRAPDPMQGSNLTREISKNKIKLSADELRAAQLLGVDPKKYAAYKGR